MNVMLYAKERIGTTKSKKEILHLVKQIAQPKKKSVIILHQKKIKRILMVTVMPAMMPVMMPAMIRIVLRQERNYVSQKKLLLIQLTRIQVRIKISL